MEEGKVKTKAARQQANQNRLIAMSHPVRADILLILTERTASPVEMARELGQKVHTVSHHAKRLVELECAELVDERPVRGAIEHFYRATERHQIDTSDWEDLHPLLAEHLVASFMQPIIDDYVASVRQGMIGSDERFHLTRTRLVLDQEGIDEALEIQERARLEIQEVQERSASRRAESGEVGTHFTSALGCFEVPPSS
jgi:predicted ArsR family transcriptional regulator